MIVCHFAKYSFLVIVGIWEATLSIALGLILGASRVLQSTARYGVLPKFLAKGYRKTNRPRIATLIVFFYFFDFSN